MRLEFTEQHFALFRHDDEFPLLTQHAQPNHRPYIHPIRAPDGCGVLTENAPAHHPWQHGLYVGLNDVNGVGFWSEGLRGSPSDGTFHPRPLTVPLLDGNKADWSVVSDWHAPDGSPLLRERQMWTFLDQGDHFTLYFTWGLRAETDVRFGTSAYGGLFLRMPFREGIGGEAVNSAGQVNQAAEAQRARWAAESMPLAERREEQHSEEWAGIAIFDHTSNREHPTPWRVDSQLGIGPSPCIAGAWSLDKGQTLYTSYGLFVFCGRIDRQKVDEKWTAFCEFK